MATMAPIDPVVEPLVLLANADKWLTESLESVLTQGGYRVLATPKRQQVVELARRYLPDGILLDVALDQRASDNLALCRSVRADPAISRATPIILMTAGPALRQQQIDALRAGAWELRGDPLDMEELVLRLGVYVQGKLEVDRLGAEGLVDRASGLYNDVGMSRRSTELAAFTAREGMALACAVFQPSDDAMTISAADRLALAVRRAGRISDAVCRTGPAEFTVFAPATDETGAEGLVQRITDTVARSAAVKLRAGISTAAAPPRRPSVGKSSPDFHQPPPPSPAELIDRARNALR
ncbi:MAG TPA: response regulator [Gemmatimonadales bacterium]|jgi:DNA-binding response OmpR family regulator